MNHINFSDCPNTFIPLNNKCYKMMKDDSYSNHYKSCWMSRGVILSFYNNQVGELIAQKLMEVYGVSSVFLGMQKYSSTTKWHSDWYSHFDTCYEIPDDEITTLIKNHVIVATLLSGTFSYASSNGHEKEDAICEFGKSFITSYSHFKSYNVTISIFVLVGDIAHTNWGITNDEFEPIDKNTKKCIKMCIDDNSVGCDGQWKSEDCETALNYVCQIPCM